MSDSLGRLLGLGAAVRTLSAAASREPKAVLEELRRHAEALLDCDAAGIHLARRRGGEVVFERVYLSPFAAARGAASAQPFRPPPVLLEPLERGEVAFFEYFRGAFGPEVIEERPWLREFASALYAPLIADEELVGVLFAGWFQPRHSDPATLVCAEALGRCAGLAVRIAGLVGRRGARLDRKGPAKAG